MNKTEPESFVRIAIIENAFEAHILASALESQGIDHRIRSYHDTAYDGLFQVQKGWGEICAPAAFRDEILDILADIRAGHSENV